jgi:DNA-binding response OmpR family regulator
MHDELREAAMAAVDQDRLLEGENPDTTHSEDARRWLVVYGELLAYKESVLERTLHAVERYAPEAAAELEHTDVPILREERDRFRRRLDYWQVRVRELGGGLDYDPGVRTIRHQGQAIRLSRREAELLSFLLEHPGQRFGPRDLAARAWLAPNLSSEQVRNYVVRLRRKLSGADLPCTLVSEPGSGYSLKWS